MTPGQGTAASTAADRAPVPETAWVYLLRCPDGSLYCGWTNDLARRLKAHQSGKGGAKYTKSHGTAAVRLTYAERCADKSAALRREAAVKKLPKVEKEALAARWLADNAVTLRMATPDDAADVADLYNWYVTHGVQTFQYAPSTHHISTLNSPLSTLLQGRSFDRPLQRNISHRSTCISPPFRGKIG